MAVIRLATCTGRPERCLPPRFLTSSRLHIWLAANGCSGGFARCARSTVSRTKGWSEGEMGQALSAGDFAPAEIELPDQHGAGVRLADFSGRNVVVYFYPMDDTPGCTVEGKEFRDIHDQFVALDCVVLGVSVETVESHRAFAAKHAFPFRLL